MTKIARRKFLKLSGPAPSRRKPAGSPASLASGRAPAYAQGTTRPLAALGRFRAGLRRAAQGRDHAGMPEGARHQAQGRDHQRQRHPGAHHLGDPVGDRARYHQRAQQLAAALRRKPGRRRATSPRRSARRRAAFTRPPRSAANDGKRWLAVPWNIVGVLIAYRKSWFDEIGYTNFPRPGSNTTTPARSSRPRAARSARRSATPLATRPLRLSLPVVVGRQGGRGRRQDRRAQQQGDGRVRSNSWSGFWKDAHDEGGLAWDDSNNNRAFLSGTICADQQRRLDLHRIQAQARHLSDREGHASEGRYPARAAARRAAGQFGYHGAVEHVDELFEESEGRQGFLALDQLQAGLREMVRVAAGLFGRPHDRLGEPSAVERGSGHAAVPLGGAHRPIAGLCRAARVAKRPRP